MHLIARLPHDRVGVGTLTHLLTSSMFRCRGKADNASAKSHGNPHRSPTRPFGDHPAGRYRITKLETSPAGKEDTFGPWRLHVQPLDPNSNDECALRERAEAGDDGIMIHSGRLNADGTLRATYGCLRVDDATMEYLALAFKEAFERGEDITYTCEVN